MLDHGPFPGQTIHDPISGERLLLIARISGHQSESECWSARVLEPCHTYTPGVRERPYPVGEIIERVIRPYEWVTSTPTACR